MVFKEFEDADRSMDPKLVESLSFHAVNGKRLRSSMEFLGDPTSRWTVKLLSVCMEPTRMLTWYWLSCIGSSLKAGERPALYKLLDPRTSVIIQALQHYSSLVMSTQGGGRMCLLWPCSSFTSFAEFCHLHQDQCRKIRRLLLLGSAWVFRRHYTYLNSDTFALTMVGDKEADSETLDNFLVILDDQKPLLLRTWIVPGSEATRFDL